jgi:hypothetical protein
MPHYYCPCGASFGTCSTVRPSRSPCLRLFMSIKTNKSISSETKVCNACRTAYYTWKKNNPEFENIFLRLEKELSDVEEIIDTNSVN